ncbi:MAG: glycosyltransferase [Rhizobiales bacterium]|nr:glycosyltransferase [Hyphomicrobiales bacterium]
MKKFGRHFLNIFGFGTFTKKNPTKNVDIEKFEKFDLSKLLNNEPIDMVIAINEPAITPSINLANIKDAFTIIDLDHPIDDNKFTNALKEVNLIFSANRQLATGLEKKLNRHIVISRHVKKNKSNTKYIDLKKVYHLIDDTQIIVFDANIQHSYGESPNDIFKQKLVFIAQILENLPRYVHLIITGGVTEKNIFKQYENIFEKHNCSTRVHFYTENLASFKYPLDFDNVDLALLLNTQNYYTPVQYYKYLSKEVPMISTEFADSNQLVTSANIGEIINNQDVEQWVTKIKKHLNASLTEKEKIKTNLQTQKKQINGSLEAKHFVNSIENMLTNCEKTQNLKACIVDLSNNKISDRTHNISYMLMEHGINVCVLTPFLPLSHTPLSHNIEYIKVS